MYQLGPVCTKELNCMLVHVKYILQIHEETRTLPCTAKVSSREATCPTGPSKVSVLLARIRPKDLAVKIGSFSPGAGARALPFPI